MKVKIKDTNIAHDLSSSPGKPPTYFDWVHTTDPADKFTFVTDTELAKPENKGGIAWIMEPPTVNEAIYHYMAATYRNYRYVLTFSKELCEMDKRFLFYPVGGARLSVDESILYTDKSKHTSLILSSKNWTVGHQLRHACKDRLESNPNVDILMPGMRGDYIPKIHACKDYMFSVVVENGRYDAYFTEKIIDCFLSNVIPIYNGCPSIGDFFDSNGIITFETLEQLEEIVDNLTEENYLDMEEARFHNYGAARHQYFIGEDWIYRNYPFLFEDNGIQMIGDKLK